MYIFFLGPEFDVKKGSIDLLLNSCVPLRWDIPAQVPLALNVVASWHKPGGVHLPVHALWLNPDETLRPHTLPHLNQRTKSIPL